MDRASFELIGNVGKLEIKPTNSGRQVAIISLATSERWKTEDGEKHERTYWHRVAVFAPAKVALIASMVQQGTRLRLVGQIRPGSWEDERGQTRYTVEFVISGVGEVEILARGKPKADVERAADKPNASGSTGSARRTPA